MSKSEKYYNVGYSKLEKDYELIGLMKTINKMKAAIAILVDKHTDDKKIFNLTMKLWIEDSSIFCCSSSNEENERKKSET